MEGLREIGTPRLWKMLDETRRDMNGMQDSMTGWSDRDWDDFSEMCSHENEIENELARRGVPREYIDDKTTTNQKQ